VRPRESWLAHGLALIFDMDGVIVDSNPVHCQAWVLYNRRFGVETDAAMLQRMYGKRNDEIVRDFFGPHLSHAEVAAHGAAKERLYRELMADRLSRSLVPGIGQFLARHGGADMALATNAEPANVAFVLEAAGLRPYFRLVVDADTVARPKPYPDIYLRAAEQLGAQPRNCIVFEDSLAGVAASRAAGMRTVGLLTTHARLPGVDVAIDDFLNPELEPWLRSQTPLA
jgi:beta-phosphoglucomutase